MQHALCLLFVLLLLGGEVDGDQNKAAQFHEHAVLVEIQSLLVLFAEHQILLLELPVQIDYHRLVILLLHNSVPTPQQILPRLLPRSLALLQEHDIDPHPLNVLSHDLHLDIVVDVLLREPSLHELLVLLHIQALDLVQVDGVVDDVKDGLVAECVEH